MFDNNREWNEFETKRKCRMRRTSLKSSLSVYEGVNNLLVHCTGMRTSLPAGSLVVLTTIGLNERHRIDILFQWSWCQTESFLTVNRSRLLSSQLENSQQSGPFVKFLSRYHWRAPLIKDITPWQMPEHDEGWTFNNLKNPLQAGKKRLCCSIDSLRWTEMLANFHSNSKARNFSHLFQFELLLHFQRCD